MKRPDIKQQPIFMLLEGDPGSGKTRFIDTANACERTSPMLHLDLHGNTIALAHVESWPHYILQIETIKDLNLTWSWLASGQPAVAPFEQLSDWFPVKFQSVGFDTLTEYHNIALDQITGNVGRKIGQPLPQAQIQHWGELLRETVFMVGKFQELGLHVFLTVQSEEKEDGNSGAILRRPQLWGKSQKAVPAYVYLHGYILQNRRLTVHQRARLKLADEMAAQTRVMLFTPQFDSMAKDQFNVLGDFMTDPTVDKIARKIYEFD